MQRKPTNIGLPPGTEVRIDTWLKGSWAVVATPPPPAPLATPDDDGRSGEFWPLAHLASGSGVPDQQQLIWLRRSLNEGHLVALITPDLALALRCQRLLTGGQP